MFLKENEKRKRRTIHSSSGYCLNLYKRIETQTLGNCPRENLTKSHENVDRGELSRIFAEERCRGALPRSVGVAEEHYLLVFSRSVAKERCRGTLPRSVDE